MIKIYVVTVDFDSTKFKLHFSTKLLSEQTITAIELILNKEGRKSVQFTTEIIDVMSDSSKILETFLELLKLTKPN